MGTLLNFVIRSSIVFTVFLIPLLWNPWTFEAFEFSKQYLLIFLVLLGLVAWLAKMLVVEREVHFKRTPLNLPIFLFVFIAVLSSVFSQDLWSSLFGYYGRFSDGLFGLLAVVGLYFLITNTVQKPSSLVRPFLLSSALVVVIGYFSLFGVLQQFPQLPPLTQLIGFNTVAQSKEGFSIFVAFLISFLALLSLRPQIKQLPFAGNLLLLFSSLGILLILDVQKAWLLLLLGLLLVLLLGLFQRAWTGEAVRLRRLWLPLILLLLTVILFFSPAKLPGIADQLPKEPMLSQETSWSIAFGTLSESGKNLALGSGLGTFALDFSKHKPADFNTTLQWQIRFDRSGNHITEILSTTGILGLLSYLALLLWFLLASLFFVKDRKGFPYVLGVLVLFLAQFLYYQTTVLAVLFWVFLALSVVAWQSPLKEFRFSLRKFPEFEVAAKALFLVVLLGMGGIFFFGARFFIADMNYLVSQNTQSSNLQARIEKTKEAVRLNPWQAEYKIFLSRLYLGRAQGELGKPENSRNQEQISQDVKLAIAYTRGDTLGNQKIVGATQLSPNRVATWETLGAVYRDITFAPGALEWGIRSFRAALSLEPQSPVLYTELGKLQVAQEDFESAREQFDAARALKPDYIEADIQLALLYEKEGDVAGALSLFSDIALRYSLNTDNTFQLGRLLYNAGKIEEAIIQFERVLETAPNHSNTLFALGAAYESQGRIEQARGIFEKVLQLNPDNDALQQKLQELTQ